MAQISKEEMFPSNNYKSRDNIEEPVEKHIDPIENKSSVRKKSIFSKVHDSFIQGDLHDVGSYIYEDVFVPSAKEILSDIFTRGLEVLLYGEARSGRSRRSVSGSRYYTEYSSIYGSGSRREREKRSERHSSEYYSLDEDIFIEDDYDSAGNFISGYAAACIAVESVGDLFAEYGQVTVADVYDAAHLTPPYTMNDYGWDKPVELKVRKVNGGGLIIMPKAKQLK